MWIKQIELNPNDELGAFAMLSVPSQVPFNILCVHKPSALVTLIDPEINAADKKICIILIIY